MTRPTQIVILTGAGISAESGIDTFRDGGGLWEQHRVEDVATPQAYDRDPDLVLRFYDMRRAAIQRALVKLGFAPRDTKIDGLVGGTTHQAIERFEKKMNWTVTGEPSAKVARALSSQSGIPVSDAPAR